MSEYKSVTVCQQHFLTADFVQYVYIAVINAAAHILTQLVQTNIYC